MIKLSRKARQVRFCMILVAIVMIAGSFILDSGIEENDYPEPIVISKSEILGEEDEEEVYPLENMTWEELNEILGEYHHDGPETEEGFK